MLKSIYNTIIYIYIIQHEKLLELRIIPNTTPKNVQQQLYMFKGIHLHRHTCSITIVIVHGLKGQGCHNYIWGSYDPMLKNRLVLCSHHNPINMNVLSMPHTCDYVCPMLTTDSDRDQFNTYNAEWTVVLKKSKSWP